jgi:hypothetical protein
MESQQNTPVPVLTDEQGYFRFKSLPAGIKYTIRVSNAAPEGAIIKEAPGGRGISVTYPAGMNVQPLLPGNTEPYTIKVQPYPTARQP